MEEVRELNEFQKALREKTLREEAEMRANQVNAEDLEEDTQAGRYMTFMVAGNCYGLAISCVNEIIGIQQITEVPDTPDYIMGLINLRGRIVPVMDVRVRFGKEPAQYHDRTCVLVIDVEDTVVGLIVDSIDEVVNIEDKDILPPASASRGGEGGFIIGLGKRDDEVKLIIDPKRLLFDAEPEDEE